MARFGTSSRTHEASTTSGEGPRRVTPGVVVSAYDDRLRLTCRSLSVQLPPEDARAASLTSFPEASTTKTWTSAPARLSEMLIAFSTSLKAHAMRYTSRTSRPLKVEVAGARFRLIPSFMPASTASRCSSSTASFGFHRGALDRGRARAGEPRR